MDLELRLVGQLSEEMVDHHIPEHYWRLRGVRNATPIKKGQVLVLDAATYLPNSHVVAVQVLHDMTPVLSEIGRDMGTSELAFCKFLLNRNTRHTEHDWDDYIHKTKERYNKLAKKLGVTT
ncbi:MAG: hypothetical protein ACXADB_14825 [Candidatus Hermodarchaeia archaeon]|jgi:hypothetical protein